ncbi:hypothetical protein [Streptomyces sp. NPDC020141]|uniref:hypothetical protein n=1 Tax=Streptomyces sp. NPDC020141 TaxID=3365065 RepID=UPI0037A678E6
MTAPTTPAPAAPTPARTTPTPAAPTASAGTAPAAAITTPALARTAPAAAIATPAPARTGPPSAGDSWAGLLSDASAACLDELRATAGEDWSRRAAGLDLSCRETLDHLALGLVGYAGLLVARPADRYITLFASLDPAAPVDTCLEGLHIASALLAATVRSTPGDVRAWHPWGRSDATGFAAMGIAELVLHTYDITRGLGRPRPPSEGPAAAVLARLFPGAPAGHPAPDTLLWCTGRAALPGLPRLGTWQWDGAVRADRPLPPVSRSAR